ncbi:hypothetical protein ACIQW5_24655 [Methylorubrum thiocyanatum]|uniref:hypothetical protein n=1 Tax=Methylorubrum thiocyanatum TaxID=47958 RepID=UPI00383B33D1
MSVLEDAISATDKAGDLAQEAADSLAIFVTGHLNGFGLFADPSSQRAHLAKAVRAAAEALAVMDTVRWPTAEELRAAEEGEPLLQP